MRDVDRGDQIGGLILALAGAAVAIYSYQELPLGEVRRMGPGMFPAALGIIVAVLGGAIFLTAHARQGAPSMPEFRSVLAIVVGMVLFALTIDRFGLVPAITLLTFVSTRASTRPNLVNIFVLNICLCVLAVLIFDIGFGLPVDAFKWSP